MGKNSSKSYVKWEALGFIFVATLAVASPIVGSAYFIKWLYYPAHAVSAIKNTPQEQAVFRQDDREEFSRSDLITVVLSAVSVILTAVTIALAVLGLFGYRAITSKAEKEARRVARKHAEYVAREASEEIIPILANAYLKLEKNDAQDYSKFFSESRSGDRK